MSLSSCECYKLLLLAVDEFKAHGEYKRMGETGKAIDELRHFTDFERRIMEKCPELYKRLVVELLKCEE